MRKVTVLAFVTGIQLFGLYSILVGVIGEKKIIDKEITPIPSKIYNNSNGGYYSSSVNKIVIFVIDALRVDFLFREKMPYVSRVLDEGNGCVFVTKVKAPTVTLPRIKALVSGDISTYWDFMHNFKSSAMTQDNFIWQARDHFKTMVFYGDDTWLKLFPKEFKRHEGVSSFFVSDFTEVDNNVTRNLRKELISGKHWDLLVLHYLGLDHIGHVHGPYSTMISSKLIEMDKIIEEIYISLKQHGTEKSLMIICGDHGMANIGGHGGNTYPEVTTPLIFLSTKSMGKCSNSNWRQGQMELVDQTDVASTLSAFWGIPFPAQSVGKLIPSVLGHLPLKNQLFALHYNAVHLKKVLSKLSNAQEQRKLLKKYNNVMEAHIQYLEKDGEESTIFHEYKTLLSDLSATCSAAVGIQNIWQLIGGGVIIFQALAMFFVPLAEEYWLHTVICSTVGIISAGVAFWLQHDLWAPLIVFNFSILIYKLDWKSSMSYPESTLSWVLLSVHYLNPVIYFSSSFIEEEHSVRYYLWASALLMFVLFFPGVGGTDTPKLSDICLQVFIGLLAHRIAIAWNQTGQKYSHLNDFVDILKEYDSFCSLIVFASIVGLYFLRKEKSSPTFLPSLICVTLLKFDTGRVSSWTLGYVSNLIKLGYLVPAFEGLSTLKAGFGRSTTLTNSWILFMMLVQRFYNIPLITLMLVQVKSALLLCDKLTQLPTRVVIFLWLAQAVYFYQGNSNSIASIDVNAGYLGLEQYNEGVVGLLIFLNTFSGPVLIILSFLDNVGENNSQRRKVTAVIFQTLARTSALDAAVYSIVILTFRHHLFIWSVFTPKLLYMIGFTVLNFCIFVVYSLGTWRLIP